MAYQSRISCITILIHDECAVYRAAEQNTVQRCFSECKISCPCIIRIGGCFEKTRRTIGIYPAVVLVRFLVAPDHVKEKGMFGNGALNWSRSNT